MKAHRGSRVLRRRAWAYRLLGPPVAFLVWVFVRVRLVGADRLPRSGPALLAVNHVSDLDPVVLAVVLWRCGRHARFLAAVELFAHPMAGPVLRATQMISVDRGGGRDRLLENALPRLAAGEVVVIYPEGTIPACDQRLAGRPGAGLLALSAQVPVIPVATWGLGVVRSDRLPRPRRPASVVFGSPLDLSHWQGRRDPEAQQEVSDAMLAAVRGLLSRAQQAAWK